MFSAETGFPSRQTRASAGIFSPVAVIIFSVDRDPSGICVLVCFPSGTEKKMEKVSTEETGEEQTIALTENTVIRKQTMGQPGGEAPEMPEGEAPENRRLQLIWKKLKTVEHSGWMVRSKRRRHGSYYSIGR